jgi:hypothetical protein
VVVAAAVRFLPLAHIICKQSVRGTVKAMLVVMGRRLEYRRCASDAVAAAVG